MSHLKLDDNVAAREDVVSCEIEGGSALLDLRSSNYFRLNETADEIWQGLAEGPVSPALLVERLTQVFEVSEGDCRQDVLTILDAFHEAGLIIRS